MMSFIRSRSRSLLLCLLVPLAAACGTDDTGKASTTSEAGSLASLGGGGSVGTGGTAGVGAPSSDCSDMSGTWTLQTWACDAEVLTVSSFGIEVSRTFDEPMTGSETTKLFVPTDQSAIWYARTHGLELTLRGAELTATTAAPAEACSTSEGDVGDWGPVVTGTGEQSCKHHVSAPGTPIVTTASCERTAASVVLTWVAAEGEEGPCRGGQDAETTWQKQ